MLSPGASFDRYVLEDLLGEGGMGSVFRAWDPKLRRRVALKIVRPERVAPLGSASTAPREEATARLVREARAAAALDHPNAVAIFDVGEVDGAPFIAMELVVGQTLRAFVGDETIPVAKKIRWLLDTAKVLSAAHDAGLVHRDVKPENVMVRDDGTVKMLDFGIARRVTSPEGATPSPSKTPPETLITERGLTIGTPLYMAPEQLRSDAIDARTDQFSWGVLAYELLAGKTPWRVGADSIHLLASILTDEPPRLDFVPESLDSLVRTALAKRPSERHASMHVVVDALEVILSAGRREAELGATQPVDREEVLRSVPPPEIPSPAASTLPPSLPRKPRRLTLPLVIAGVIGAAAIGAAAMLLASPSNVDIAPQTPAEPTAMPITSLPLPRSKSPAALSAFSGGLQALRDGAARTALGRFEEAVKEDPSMAEAWVRIALQKRWFSPTETREALRHATQHRAGLSPRDEALLDATEPLLRLPYDHKERERRLTKAAETFSTDAEIAFELGKVRFELGQAEPALSAMRHALTIDPRSVLALQMIGQIEAYLGNYEAGLEALQKALTISPMATAALVIRELIFEQRGDCAAIEVDARTWIAVAGDDPDGYDSLATALASMNRPREAVLAALLQKWSRLSGRTRDKTEALDRLRLSLMAGDFADAEQRARALDALSADEASEEQHAPAARHLIEILRETGRLAEAADVAQSYLERREAWLQEPRGEDYAAAKDMTPLLLDTLYRAGRIDEAEHGKRRSVFLDAWAKKAPPAFFGSYIWFHAYAETAQTKEEATEAFLAAERYAPLPVWRPITFADGAVGRLHLLVGETDRAIPLLRSGAAICRTLQDPMKQTKLYVTLGSALAASGDKEGACAAYGQVETRWGSAKPRSMTLEEARAGRRALTCAEPAR